jgi:hypothetical protein
VPGVEVDANGRIGVIAGDPAIVPIGVNDRDDQADLDRELAEFERARG